MANGIAISIALIVLGGFLAAAAVWLFAESESTVGHRRQSSKRAPSNR
jgi:hypothetical protein